MMGTEIRKRVKNHKKESAPELQPHARSKTQFVPRESLLTQLLTTSRHIRAIYHIFLVILAMLFFDTVLYDFFQHGKIDAGVGTVLAGFGDVRRAARLWLYELMVALTFLPGFHLYGAVYRILRQYTAIRRIWSALGIMGLIGIQALLLGVPLWSLSKERLALASAATVTCEMFRFAMKIHAVAAECAGRCSAGERAQPLPTFSQYVYFLFAPTLIYRDQYPRTKSTRWRLVVFYFAEVAGIVFYNSFLWERFIIPRWHDYGKQEQVEVGVMLRDMFACVLPSVLAFLCGFYCLLHAWFNAFAEMLTFADRLFYEDWWTQSQFSHFYRSWNLVVHTWLREYIYRPLSLHTGRMFATLTVFLVSAVAHEVVLAASFGFFYPVMFLEFGVIGLLVVPLTAVGGRRYPDFYNFLLWLSFFIGNGLMWSLYPMEHFARLNCAPAENDSFFVPKSWSCPRVVIKSNWSFHNPFSLAD